VQIEVAGDSQYRYRFSLSDCPQHWNVQGSSHPHSSAGVPQDLHSATTCNFSPHSAQ